MKFTWIHTLMLGWLCFSLTACNFRGNGGQKEIPRVTSTVAKSMSVTMTRKYFGQIQSHRHVDVHASTNGKLEEVLIANGESVKQGELLFTVSPTNDETKKVEEPDADPISVKATFNGIVSGAGHPLGKPVAKGETLATVSDDSLMWAYFDVSETGLMEMITVDRDQQKNDLKVELLLPNGEKYDQLGKIGKIETDVNRETGGHRCRVDFPNPDHILHHGQVATVSISFVQNDAIVIPQKATFVPVTTRYVFIIDKDDKIILRQILIDDEFQDQFVLKSGLTVGDRIVLDGIGLVRVGEKVIHDD